MSTTPRCPSCGSERLEPTVIQVYFNTGARWLCLSCGLPINSDGTENQVLIRQPVDPEEPEWVLTAEALLADHKRTGEPLDEAEVAAIVASGAATRDEFDMRGGGLWWHHPTFPDADGGDEERRCDAGTRAREAGHAPPTPTAADPVVQQALVRGCTGTRARRWAPAGAKRRTTGAHSAC